VSTTIAEADAIENIYKMSIRNHHGNQYMIVIKQARASNDKVTTNLKISHETEIITNTKCDE